MELAEPGTLGFDTERLRRLTWAVERDVDSGFYDGAQIAVGRTGHLVCSEAIGYADRAQGRPLQRDDITVPFS
ncbi:MAG: serine hydrolase domain-containing protein, partial [Acidimicrobiales bacterium]